MSGICDFVAGKIWKYCSTANIVSFGCDLSAISFNKHLEVSTYIHIDVS